MSPRTSPTPPSVATAEGPAASPSVRITRDMRVSAAAPHDAVKATPVAVVAAGPRLVEIEFQTSRAYGACCQIKVLAAPPKSSGATRVYQRAFLYRRELDQVIAALTEARRLIVADPTSANPPKDPT